MHIAIERVTSNVPNGSVLYSVDQSGPFASPVTLRLAAPVEVRSGTAFAIVLSSTDGTCGFNEGTANPYPAGNAYYDARPNAPGWAVVSGDLLFETYVDQ